MPSILISDGLIYFIFTKGKADLSKRKAKFRVRLPPLCFLFHQNYFQLIWNEKEQKWEVFIPSVIKDWWVARDVLGTLIHQLRWPGKQWHLRCSEPNVSLHHLHICLLLFAVKNRKLRQHNIYHTVAVWNSSGWLGGSHANSFITFAEGVWVCIQNYNLWMHI